MEKWSLKEKTALFEALEEYGDDNLVRLQLAVPTKSKLAIQKYLEYFKSFALKSLNSDYSSTSASVGKITSRLFNAERLKFDEDSPLCQWTNVLAEHQKTSGSTLACALKLIAHMEEHPEKTKDFELDSKELYLNLASAIKGEIKENNSPEILTHMTHSLVYLANRSLCERKPEHTDYIQSITRIFPDSSIDLDDVPSSSQDHVHSALKDIQLSPMYNPLSFKTSFLFK